ncbi:hypothetical protein [Tenacibaculum retecalamus]|uniref:hypothetical protein n=1 Tax=Tenacibaculum retecalamus TaxID=3018315 RepID=UPI0023D90AD4|nr:hypothetical protein [Tenacibaculum retecalamus]WBX71662.1 hypothetical protein PG912_02410 [Tenacibaculum retecalamus]
MSTSKHIIFLNPPGGNIFIRDYYCSKVSKAYYLPQPVDLLIQSSFFNEPEYKILVLDCIAENKTEIEALKIIRNFNPNYIIGLMGSVSLNEDSFFYKKVKQQNPNVLIACSGDSLLEKHKEKFKKYKWLNAIITNFFKDGFKQYIEGENEIEALFIIKKETYSLKTVSVQSQ